MKTMIEVKDLSFIYPKSDVRAINNISFEIKKGEIFGFLGPNGAGKSTTQKILIKLLKPFSGSVSVLGKSIDEWGTDYYEKIGVGFELPNHYSKLTALENLQFFGNFYNNMKDPMEILTMLGLQQDANKLVGEFSKGMKMRLNFARAIMHDPEVLFLDEPTSGLDPVNHRLLKDIILKKKAEGKTIFLTTHNMSDAEDLCDRVGFIVKGKIVVIEKPNELKIKHGQRKVTVGIRNNQDIHYNEFSLDNLGQNQEFFKLIQTNKIETIHSNEASLEDIFIKITGARLD
jgi:fluoroquinolone transport system ATP-binding protein